MFVSVQSFSRQLYNHNTDISQLRHHSQLLTQSTVSDMVSVDVKELVDTWNKLVAETSDREVRLSPTVSLHVCASTDPAAARGFTARRYIS